MGGAGRHGWDSVLDLNGTPRKFIRGISPTGNSTSCWLFLKTHCSLPLCLLYTEQLLTCFHYHQRLGLDTRMPHIHMNFSFLLSFHPSPR